MTDATYSGPIWEGERAPLIKALLVAQMAAEAVLKAAVNPAFKSRYADLAHVVEAVVPALNAAGVAVIQSPWMVGDTVMVTTILAHESGSTLTDTLPMRPTKPDPQGVGSAITYARRYALLAMTGAAPEDDDGNHASRPVSDPLRTTPSPVVPQKVVNPETGRMIDPMSPNQARKDGRGEKYDKLGHEITDLTEVSECIAWANANKALIETMPKTWQDDLRAKLSEHMHGLREAAETMFRTSGQNGVDGRDSDMDDEGGDYLTRQFKASIAHEAAKAVA